MRGYSYSVLLQKLTLVFSGDEFQCSQKIGKRGWLLLSHLILITSAITFLFIVLGLLLCNSGYDMKEIWDLAVDRNTRIYVNSIAGILLRKNKIL